METKLERIAEISANSPRPEFTSLYHLINKEMLLQCHKELDGNKAVGVDEITKKEYERNLEQNIDDFLIAVRKSMEMKSLTAPMLRELIDHIDVYEKEGGKKNYTQRIVIYYRFVGYLELPSTDD